MVLFLTVVLILSCAGMAGILLLKRYELRSGRVLMSAARPQLGSFFSRGLFWVERVLPSLAQYEARRLWRALRALLRAAAARALLWTEHGLERGLRALRSASAHAPARGGDASPFLREVVEHKKKLQEEREE